MNKIYKVFTRNGKKVVTSELGKSCGKGVSIFLSLLAGFAFAEPTLVEDGTIATGSKEAINGGQAAELRSLIYSTALKYFRVEQQNSHNCRHIQ